SRIETDNPRSASIRQMYTLVFAEHGYGRPLLGTPATMRAANQQNLKEFNQRHYTPDNMALVVVGPVDARAVRAAVDRTFGTHPRGRERSAADARPGPVTDIVRRTVERPEQQAYLVLGWPAPSFSEIDGAALDLVTTILAGSESSRLAR